VNPSGLFKRHLIDLMQPTIDASSQLAQQEVIEETGSVDDDSDEEYWAEKVGEASAVKAGLRNIWQKLIVAVDRARTGGPPLEDEIVNAVVKFNTKEYEDCQVKEIIINDLVTHFQVFCGDDEDLVLGGTIFKDSAIIDALESPNGYGSGTDLMKLFEAMTRFQGAKTCIIGEDQSGLHLFRDKDKKNPEIRSTVLMTLLSGEFNSYYHKLGYRYSKDDDDIMEDATKKLLAMTVGGWIDSPAATALVKQSLSGYCSPEMRFYLCFQDLHKQASGVKGKPVDAVARQLLLKIVSGMKKHEWRGHAGVADAYAGYNTLLSDRSLSKTF
jgi:hypothetical protein